MSQPAPALMNFPGKESACSARDLSSIPGSGRPPGKGNGNPLQYFYLGNPNDRGAWWSSAHGGLKRVRYYLGTEQTNLTSIVV